MTFIDGALWGVAGSLVNELIYIHAFRRDKLIWPWKDKKLKMTISFYIYGVFVRFLAAFIVVGLLSSSGNVSTEWFAAVTGACAVPVFLGAVSILQSEKGI